MVSLSKLRVMISSKCKDTFPAGKKSPTLSDTRKALKQEIEALQIAGRPAFEVWINESEPPQGGNWDSWDVCLNAVRECDILIALSNGDAGWAKDSETVGICHAELMTALDTAPAKVRLIALPNIAVTKDGAGERNQRFQDYVSTQNLFRGDSVRSVDDLKERMYEALYDAVLRLAQAGVREASRGRFHSGAPLDWTRLDFPTRRQQMTEALRGALPSAEDASGNPARTRLKIGGHQVLCVLDAIPAALTVPAAREMVGQPFLRDHLLAELVRDGTSGPLHLIACQKTATEAQATKLLGFPDAMVVSAPFGVFVADPVQMVQFAFIVNCRDDTSTRHGVQRFFEWLRQTGEEANVAQRASSRARIVGAVAQEQKAPAKPAVASRSKRKPGATTRQVRK